LRKHLCIRVVIRDDSLLQMLNSSARGLGIYMHGCTCPKVLQRNSKEFKGGIHPVSRHEESRCVDDSHEDITDIFSRVLGYSAGEKKQPGSFNALRRMQHRLALGYHRPGLRALMCVCHSCTQCEEFTVVNKSALKGISFRQILGGNLSQRFKLRCGYPHINVRSAGTQSITNNRYNRVKISPTAKEAKYGAKGL
jgi:hypothetical protein